MCLKVDRAPFSWNSISVDACGVLFFVLVRDPAFKEVLCVYPSTGLNSMRKRTGFIVTELLTSEDGPISSSFYPRET